LLGEKLTSFTTSDKVFYIRDVCGLVKTSLESIAD